MNDLNSGSGIFRKFRCATKNTAQALCPEFRVQRIKNPRGMNYVDLKFIDDLGMTILKGSYYLTRLNLRFSKNRNESRSTSLRETSRSVMASGFVPTHTSTRSTLCPSASILERRS
jgi:hypothetical protein